MMEAHIFLGRRSFVRRGLAVAAAVLCAWVLWITPAAAAVPDVSAVVQGIQTVYGAMHSFEARFTQELLHQESGVTEKRSGLLQFRKPLLVRWESADPQPELLLVTDREIWNWLPDEEVAYRYSLELAQDSRSMIMVVTGQAPLDRDFDVEPMSEPGDDGLVHLLLYPREPSPQLTEAQLWVDPQSFLIRRVMVMDFYGNTNRVILDSLTPDASVPDAAFAFTPPAGTEVEDHLAEETPVGIPLLN